MSQPEKIGHYTIVSQLGRGGMGVVYKAREEALNRFVAIKVLTERLTEDNTFLERFTREARAAARVSHPNIVPIYFIGEHEGNPYFVMEYVSGRSLNYMITAEGRIGNPRSAQIILQAAQGLAAAHDEGIIHRDIKPANLMVDDRGTVKIADFGLALPVDAEQRLTASGMLVGTPGFLAPEQCRGDKVDHRTDIYALGVTFYVLLAGTPPFRGESPLALIRQILDEEPPDVSALNPDVDAETKRILAKMIAKDRNQRYQTCHEIVADLEEYLAKRGVRSVTTGLGNTRVPTVSRTATALATPTIAMSSELPPAAPNEAETVHLKASPTHPDLPLHEQVTMVPPAAPATSTNPPAVSPLAAVPPATTPAAPSSSRLLPIFLVLGVILISGGVGAAILARHFFFADKPAASSATLQQQAASQSTTASSPGQPAATVPSATATTSDAGVLMLHPISTDTGTPATVGAPAVPVAAAGTPLRGNAGPQPTTQQRVPQNPAAPQRVPTPVEPATASTPQNPRNAAPAAPTAIAVAVIGDPNIKGDVAELVRSELASAGAEVVDAESNASTESMMAGGTPTAGGLMSALRGSAGKLLFVKIDATGERQLEYMGRSSTALSSRVTLTAYDTRSGRTLGSRSGKLEYTTFSATREVEKAVGPMAREIAETLTSH